MAFVASFHGAWHVQVFAVGHFAVLRKQKSIRSDLMICVLVVEHRLASWSSIFIHWVGISILMRVDGIFLLINRVPPFLESAYHRHTIYVNNYFNNSFPLFPAPGGAGGYTSLPHIKIIPSGIHRPCPLSAFLPSTIAKALARN